MQELSKLNIYVAYLAAIRQISLLQLSEMLGCTEQQTNLFLRGDAQISHEQIMELAKVLGTTAEDLQCRE